jgi:uncharacterized sulfatase
METKQKRDRRTFINQSAAVGAAVALSGGSFPAWAAATGADKRPNILFALGDDWGWPACGAYGDKVVKTPTFDRVAREGVLFTNAFSAVSSCTPSRGAILTGQAAHRLEAGGNLWSALPRKFEVYPDVLEAAGYFVGLQGKGWGPGNFQDGGWTRNPAGPSFKTFEQFFKSVPEGKPWCFWFGSHDPHRAYEKGSGVKSGMKIEDVVVPPFWPDTPEVRSDICDYYFEIQRCDRDTGEMIKLIEAAGQLDNTLVVMSGDNGMPFPRCKANLYNYGSHQPLAVRWPARVKGGRTMDDFVVLTDLAPTFLEAAGLKPLPAMTGRSFLDLLAGENPVHRDKVFLERERHANVRAGDKSYPMRAVRTGEFLYIRNLRPELWPAGDPEMWESGGPFGDCDGGPTRGTILSRRDEEGMKKFFRLCFDKRPAEELYDLAKDPGELNNVADKPDYAEAKTKLRTELDRWMQETADPRAANPDDDRWDRYPYYGGGGGKKNATKKDGKGGEKASPQEGKTKAGKKKAKG